MKKNGSPIFTTGIPSSQTNTFIFRARVWLYEGMAGWCFVTLPKKQSTQIGKSFALMKRGWGSLRVQVGIGQTSWRTSIFPDKKTGTYLLPLKAEIRKKENISVGDTIRCKVEVLL